MGKHDKRILKYLSKNADQTPTITELTMKLGLSIADVASTLDGLLAQGLVSKRLNAQGIENWFSGPGSGFSSNTSQPAAYSHTAQAEIQAPAMEAMPTSTFPQYQAAPSGGVSWYGLIMGLLIAAGGGAAGGHFLAKDAVKNATKGLVDQETYEKSMHARTDFEEKAKTRVVALEAQVKTLSAAVDSLKAAESKDEKPVAKSTRRRRR
jgi:hypothetical protein